MKTSESLDALRRANPRAQAGYAQSVEAAAETVRARIDADRARPAVAARAPRSRPGRSLAGISLAGAAVAAASVAAALTLAPTGGGPGVEDAAAAVKRAATATAVTADRSGTALVRITHDGELWAGKTIRWHQGDLAVSREAALHGRKAGDELLVVDGMMYGVDPEVDGGWIVLGSPESIDPGSGTTPDDYLGAVREDVGGVTLRRITEGMSGLTRRRLADGTTLYSGVVAAGLIARESGFKEGRTIRALPFGYVAHDEAADPAAPLDTAVTVGPDGVIREIAVTWGGRGSAWTYTVTYTGLGTTPALVAPADPRPLRDRWPAAPARRP